MNKNLLPLAFAFLLGYVVNDFVNVRLIEEAKADSNTIQRILYCIDGSSITGCPSSNKWNR
jgi:hypothetical protein